jgi:hypothetical protein
MGIAVAAASARAPMMRRKPTVEDNRRADCIAAGAATERGGGRAEGKFEAATKVGKCIKLRRRFCGGFGTYAIPKIAKPSGPLFVAGPRLARQEAMHVDRAIR